MAELEPLQLAATNATGALNARGGLLEDCLWDVSVRVEEIALHGVPHGATFPLMAVRVNSGHELR